MQFATFCDLNVGADQFFDGISERLTNIPTIGQDASDGLSVRSTPAQRQQGAVTIGHVGRRNGNGVR